MDNIAPYAKAVTATLVAGLGVIGAGLTDGNLQAEELVAAATAALVALGAVFGVRNTPKINDGEG